MDIAPFKLEEFFGKYEHSVKHTLSASDCESLTIGELCKLAGVAPAELCAVPLGYPPIPGSEALRAAIAKPCRGLSPEDVVVCAAPEEGIYLFMRTFLNPSDRVVVLTPCYESLASIARHIGCQVHDWPIRETDNGYELDLASLDRLLAEKPRLVVVNFPHNPTGFLPNREQFAELVRRVEASGAWLFSDEMYRGLERDTAARLPTAVELSSRAVVLSGLSKAYGLPGLRTGWLALRDPALRARVLAWKNYTTICSPAPSEFLATAALGVADTLTGRCREIIAKNLVLAEEFVSRHRARFSWRAPAAGTVALVDTDLADTTAACHAIAARADILVLPGSVLGARPRTIRFGLGRSTFATALATFEANLSTFR